MRKLEKRPIRNGAVTIELAITLPVLILLLLGTVDAGQFANSYQNVSDASRAGARMAARATTTSASQVSVAVDNYLDSAFGSDVGNVTVTVRNSNGDTVSSLSSIPAGAAVEVEVSMPYSEVRIFPGIPQFENQTIETTCVMIRQ